MKFRALISTLPNDYNLLSRSLKDELIEPTRSILIPKFEEVKNEALNQGIEGISGSGQFLHYQRMETAKM